MTLIRFFDRLEDKIRGRLSHWPIVYGFFGGIGTVLFWRGVWHTADFVAMYYFEALAGNTTIDFTYAWDGPISLIIGSILLLTTGLLVSNFIGNEIIMSGLRGEKKLTERTETEVRTETGAIHEIRAEVRKIRDQLDEMRK
jgi:hypothetical protein